MANEETQLYLNGGELTPKQENKLDKASVITEAEIDAMFTDW